MRQRSGVWILAIPALAITCAGCGYGKDTGPKKPRESQNFMPTLARFTQRMERCIGDAVKVNLNRPITQAEFNNKELIKKAINNLRTELLQCFTGKGYGNEVQIEANHVEVWLAKPSCPEFAKAVFTSPRCNVLQMTLADSGFSEAPPKPEPPKKKRATPPAGSPPAPR